MKKKYSMIAVAAAAVITLLGSSGAVFAAEDSECNRQCLVNMMQQYLAALVKHNPKAVPFSDEVKFVESTANIPIGKGFWVTASEGPSDFQIYAADPIAQQVSCRVIMKENNKDILLGARIKLEDLKITEAEHLVVRDLGSSPAGQAAVNNLKQPQPGLLEDLRGADRTPRWKMLQAGHSYYEALTKEDGKLLPFAPECERHENGMVTAGGPPAPKSTAKTPAPKMDPELEKMMAATASLGP